MTHKKKKNERRNKLNLLIMQLGIVSERAREMGVTAKKLFKLLGYRSAKRLRHGTPGAFGPTLAVVSNHSERRIVRFPCAGNAADRRRFRRSQERKAA